MKTEWNLELLYKNDNDPQIKKDLNQIDKTVDNFVKKYSLNSKYLNSVKTLLKALQDYELIFSQSITFKPYQYFHFRKDLDCNNKKAVSELNKLEDFYNTLFNKVVFFKLNLGKLSKAKQEQYLKHKDLSKYHYLLKNIFENSKYDLSEKEEQILNLMSQPGHSMWVNGVDKVLSNQEITFKKKKISTYEAISMCSSLNKKDRDTLRKLINQKFYEASDFAEAEINAVNTTKKITDSLRAYEKPYSKTVRNYENEDETVKNLVDVTTKYFRISNKFYKLKAKILKLDKLKYSDRSAKIGGLRQKFDIQSAIKITKDAFAKVDKKYVDIFESFLKNGQIDFSAKKGKTGGAYCSSSYGLPTFVLLNHADNMSSVRTLAHEMGHAFHSELTNTEQPQIYAEYSYSVAETASTLFENFVFEEIYEKLNDKEKIIALHNKIGDDVSTIFRQIACFNFENEMHELSRKEGYLSKDSLARLMNKHMQKYLGPVFDLEEEDGYFWVNWGHLRKPFYVYAYAFGALISNSMYAKYKEDNSFLEKIEEFLKAGGSKKPENIFSDIGIDIRNPEFFESGLKLIEKDIKELERLVG